MSALWTSTDAEAATLGHATKAFSANGLSIDTRTLREGDLFVALKGDSRDGHDFVRAAFEAKAGAALVSRQPEGASGAMLVVANTQRGLEDLAVAARARSNAKIVGVTGSAGKTTTKEILRVGLGALGKTHASAASYNNHWGVPLSLASLPQDARYAVFEIGMNHFNEIRVLVGFVRPHVALVTTIAPAHLEFFGSCEAIADAKSEIFEGVEPGGAALIPSDSPYAERLIARAKQSHVSRIQTFGEKTGSDARLLDYSESADGSHVKADICGLPVEFSLGAAGRHIANNALGALLSVAALEGDVLNAAAAMKQFAALKGRGARFTAGDVEVIDESYNANPASMAAALALLGAAKGRRIAVLGDMLEMGEGGAEHHAAIAKPIEAARADLVFLCGPQMLALWDKLPTSRRGGHAMNSTDLSKQLRAALQPGDTVLVKGSNGMKLSVIIEALRARA
ncbi:MAG TPA: UDP-N-acetylmuramoyl-tripeptide--D-alanyl-D-alanine ligase [Rhizomicrobium sp.]|nr:UDP-N-acetylmuramoyl-tripeptide--D-alanyl-D-alanine ligase [Rhizomicrobium sp.]